MQFRTVAPKHFAVNDTFLSIEKYHLYINKAVKKVTEESKELLFMLCLSLLQDQELKPRTLKNIN